MEVTATVVLHDTMTRLARKANHHTVLCEIYDFLTHPLLDAVILEFINPPTHTCRVNPTL